VSGGAAAEPLLEVEELTIGFPVGSRLLLAADRVSFSVARGQTLGLVGESGCGKSVTVRSLVGLVPWPGEVLEGSIRWRGRELLPGSRCAWGAVRGTEVGMIFQDPTASLNPVLSVGAQLVETLRMKARVPRRAAPARAEELLHRVGISAPRARLHSYPHQLSGGMRQRVMIALAIASGPALLLADEPTTALDLTIQDQILSLLAELQRETEMAMILVSHDLGVVAQNCDNIAVRYAGRIVERGPAQAVLGGPRHPYTRALIAAVPPLQPQEEPRPLTAIAGQPPSLVQLPRGCSFTPRCTFATDACAEVTMELDRPAPEQASACPFV
jgi:peptide/nickel transport system ATP-binding protein